MGWPQITLIALYALALLLAANQHGKPREGSHSFWTSVIGVAINVGLLWAGGFFR